MPKLIVAREAYDAHEHVMKINPARQDAGLIVGTYRYLVAALALPFRMVAYVAGFGGGKERGLQLIEGAASYRGDNQADAQVALVLLYNRERRYDDALKVLADLRGTYPRNRLFWLEAGATSLRAGRAADADRFLTDGIANTVSIYDLEGRLLQRWGAACQRSSRQGRGSWPLSRARQVHQSLLSDGRRRYRRIRS